MHGGLILHNQSWYLECTFIRMVKKLPATRFSPIYHYFLPFACGFKRRIKLPVVSPSDCVVSLPWLLCHCNDTTMCLPVCHSPPTGFRRPLPHPPHSICRAPPRAARSPMALHCPSALPQPSGRRRRCSGPLVGVPLQSGHRRRRFGVVWG